MGLISVTLPTIGQPNSTEDVDVLNVLTELVNLVNGQIDPANLAAAAKPATLLGHWRTLTEARSVMRGDVAVGIASGKHWLTAGGWAVQDATSLSNAYDMSPALVVINAADLAVSGLTAKMRLRVALATCAASVAWTSFTFTFGLYPVTFTGSGQVQPAMGTVVAGTTIALNPTGNSQQKSGVSSEFALPADGFYVLGVSLNAGLADISRAVLLDSVLQVRHV